MFEEPEFIEEISENNLYLRRISKDDANFFYESLTRSNEITTFLSLGPLRSLDHARRLIKTYIKSWETCAQFNYIILLKNENVEVRIGSVSLWNVSWLHRRAEVGIWLLTEFWGQGYGTTALELIKRIGFFHLKLNRLEAHIAVENERSIKMFVSRGFEKEGILKKYLNLNGRFKDALILAHLKDPRIFFTK
jgi:ribosomal-protein-alanine N-acetyltransferase